MDARTSLGIQRSVIAACGVTAFVLGVTVHADRSSLAVALVGLGGALLLVALLLPRIQSFDANIAGVALSLKLADPVTGASDVAFQDSIAGDLRGAAPYDSGADFRRIVNGPPLRYLIISLESGRSWLTSRLYVFVALLRDHRDLGAVVFTTADETHRNIYVGLASVCDVTDCLERAYPWLAVAYATSGQPPGPAGTAGQLHENPPLLDPNQVFSSFVMKLRPPFDPAPPADELAQISNVTERARWIDYALLRRLLGASLDTRKVAETSEASELKIAVAGIHGSVLVAVTDSSGGLTRVIDRMGMLDELAATAAVIDRNVKSRSRPSS